MCDKTCGGGIQLRTRNCTNPPPTNGGLPCAGTREEDRRCNNASCPGERGTNQFRAQLHSPDPPPNSIFPGVENIVRCQHYLPVLLEVSNFFPFPEIDGGWSAWGAWGRCSVTCGSGVHQRQRNCTNPPPSANGRPCNGSDEQAAPCDLLDCSGRVPNLHALA